MSVVAVPVSVQGFVTSVINWPQVVFAVWIAIGVVALVVGFAAVRASTRRLRRSGFAAESVVAFESPVASKQSIVRVTA
jgi:hypothetical protein